MPATESALWIAAAEGTVGMYDVPAPGGRVGLKSMLFFRDLSPLKPSEMPGISGGRVGEASRDGLGELAVDGGFDKRGVVDARNSGGGEADNGWVSFLLATPPTPLSVLTGSGGVSSSSLEVADLSAGNAMVQG